MSYELEYQQLTKKKLPETKDVFDVIEEGLPLSAVDNLAKRLSVNASVIMPLLGSTTRTLQRLKKQKVRAKHRLPSQVSDFALQLTQLFNLCVETFGSEENAQQWLKRSNFALGDKSPMEIMSSGTVTGLECVKEVVLRIKYGFLA